MDSRISGTGGACPPARLCPGCAFCRDGRGVHILAEPAEGAPDHPETPVHPGQGGTHAAARCLVCRARAEGEAEAIRFAVRNIEQSTGPTGGWLRSPANLIENLTGERPAPDPGDGTPWGDGGRDRRAGDAGLIETVAVQMYARDEGRWWWHLLDESVRRAWRTRAKEALAAGVVSPGAALRAVPAGDAPAAGGGEDALVNAIVDRCAMNAGDWDRLSPQAQVRHILAAYRAARAGEGEGA